jgi:hypothetical protein
VAATGASPVAIVRKVFGDVAQNPLSIACAGQRPGCGPDTSLR